MGNTFPLTNRKLSDDFAYLTQDNKATGDAKGFVDVQRFIDTVVTLSKILPNNKNHVINLCENRYLFTVALCATILKKHINLLPSNKNIETQQRLSQRYENTYAIHDGVEVSSDLVVFDLNKQDFFSTSSTDEIPSIRLDQLVAISFTSGSTGNAKPNEKTWNTFVESTKINSFYMVPKIKKTIKLLATVPAQHMWGLETSVLMALFSNVCVVDSKPLFHQDIQDLLNTLPEPRMMVSTPVHLRSLVASRLKYPKLKIILCATSPLTKELAIQVESLFKAELREVYGCSEIGSIAVRSSAKTDVWKKFEGIYFDPVNTRKIRAYTKYVGEAVILGDFIEILDSQQFRLKGRVEDMIDIAGKRGSLYEMNKVLQSFPGLIDGAVFLPPQDRVVPRLVAIVILAEGMTKKDVAQHFRKYLDAAFVPRPIFVTDKLPREDNGKLPLKRLLTLYEDILSQHTIS